MASSHRELIIKQIILILLPITRILESLTPRILMIRPTLMEMIYNLIRVIHSIQVQKNCALLGDKIFELAEVGLYDLFSPDERDKSRWSQERPEREGKLEFFLFDKNEIDADKRAYE